MAFWDGDHCRSIIIYSDWKIYLNLFNKSIYLEIIDLKNIIYIDSGQNSHQFCRQSVLLMRGQWLTGPPIYIFFANSQTNLYLYSNE